MSFLSTAVNSSVTWDGIGLFKYERLSHGVKSSLKSVTKRQRHKFKKYGVVPQPVLEALWSLGFLPEKEAPQQGMKISTLTAYLQQGNFQDQASLDKGRWLYEEIVKDEFGGPAMKQFRWDNEKWKNQSRG